MLGKGKWLPRKVRLFTTEARKRRQFSVKIRRNPSRPQTDQVHFFVSALPNLDDVILSLNLKKTPGTA